MASSASPPAGSTDVLAVCWKAGTLGCAFLDGTVLRFCEAADAAPGFAVLQNAFIEADFGGDDGAADKYFEAQRDAFRAITSAA